MERVRMIVESMIMQLTYTKITWSGIIEILIIAVLAYRLVLWIKNTKAWMLLRGILVIFAFVLIAQFLNLTTILYLVEVSLNALVVAAVVVFQPEIRRALENLGQRNILSAIAPFDRKKDNEKFSIETVEHIVDACISMGQVKTGALIVIERDVRLSEFEETGIEMDCLISYQVLVNIFEHNTPLHDGAIIVNGNRILAATCYLPLSDNNNLSKDLGTRHRAAVGMSEVSDALVLVVSEETGSISIVEAGGIERGVSEVELRKKLMELRIVNSEQNRRPLVNKVLKGGKANEEKTPK